MPVLNTPFAPNTTEGVIDDTMFFVPFDVRSVGCCDHVRGPKLRGCCMVACDHERMVAAIETSVVEKAVMQVDDKEGPDVDAEAWQKERHTLEKNIILRMAAEEFEEAPRASAKSMTKPHLVGFITHTRVFPRSTYGDKLAKLEFEGPRGFTHVRCPVVPIKAHKKGRAKTADICHIDSIVITVGTASQGQGDEARHGYGVYFGKIRGAASKNIAHVLKPVQNPSFSPSNQRAELAGLFRALQAALRFVKRGGQWDCGGECETPCAVRHVIIKSDSQYVVTGMRDDIWRWAANDWKTSKRRPVKNEDRWKKAKEMADAIEAIPAALDFWLVGKDENVNASELAKGALSGPSVESRAQKSKPGNQM